MTVVLGVLTAIGLLTFAWAPGASLHGRSHSGVLSVRPIPDSPVRHPAPPLPHPVPPTPHPEPRQRGPARGPEHPRSVAQLLAGIANTLLNLPRILDQTQVHSR